jgi:hypothetical protein
MGGREDDGTGGRGDGRQQARPPGHQTPASQEVAKSRGRGGGSPSSREAEAGTLEARGYGYVFLGLLAFLGLLGRPGWLGGFVGLLYTSGSSGISGTVGDSPGGPLKQLGKPHLKPAKGQGQTRLA